MAPITPELQEAWDRILKLDAEVKYWKQKHHDLQVDTDDLKLKVTHALNGLVELVDG